MNQLHNNPYKAKVVVETINSIDEVFVIPRSNGLGKSYLVYTTKLILGLMGNYLA